MNIDLRAFSLSFETPLTAADGIKIGPHKIETPTAINDSLSFLAHECGCLIVARGDALGTPGPVTLLHPEPMKWAKDRQLKSPHVRTYFNRLYMLFGAGSKHMQQMVNCCFCRCSNLGWFDQGPKEQDSVRTAVFAKLTSAAAAKNIVNKILYDYCRVTGAMNLACLQGRV